MIPTLQYYKYLYAIRLIDLGLANEALHYLEEISSHILKRPGEYWAQLIYIYTMLTILRAHFDSLIN